MQARLIPGSEYTDVTFYTNRDGSTGEYLTSVALFEVTAFGETRVVKGRRVHKYHWNEAKKRYHPVLWWTDGHALAAPYSGGKLHPCTIELWQDGPSFTVVSAVRVRNNRRLWPIVAWDAEKWASRKAHWYAGGAQVRRDILKGAK